MGYIYLHIYIYMEVYSFIGFGVEGLCSVFFSCDGDEEVRV